MFYLIFDVLVSCLSLKLLNFHIAWNCMHFLGYLLQHHNPHKTLCCLSSGTSLSESLKKGEIPCAEIVFESYTNHAGTILSPKIRISVYLCTSCSTSNFIWLCLQQVLIFPVEFNDRITHSLQRVPGDSLESMVKLRLSTKFPQKEIRWNYSILCSAMISVLL